jgi:hypothetical protein
MGNTCLCGISETSRQDVVIRHPFYVENKTISCRVGNVSELVTASSWKPHFTDTEFKWTDGLVLYEHYPNADTRSIVAGVVVDATASVQKGAYVVVGVFENPRCLKMGLAAEALRQFFASYYADGDVLYDYDGTGIGVPLITSYFRRMTEAEILKYSHPKGVNISRFIRVSKY